MRQLVPRPHTVGWRIPAALEIVANGPPPIIPTPKDGDSRRNPPSFAGDFVGNLWEMRLRAKLSA